MSDDGRKLQVLSKGTGGLKEFQSQLDPKLILFGGLKVVGVDVRDNVTSRRPKFLGITFKGKEVGALKKARVSVQRTDAQKKMGGMALAIDIEDADELTEKELAKRLLGCGGAHKPTHYDFGPDQERLIEDLLA